MIPPFRQAMAEISHRFKIPSSTEDVDKLERDLRTICESYRQGLSPLQQQQVLNFAKKCIEKAKVDKLH